MAKPTFKTTLARYQSAQDSADLYLQELLELSFQQVLTGNLDYIKMVYNAVPTRQRKSIREYFLEHTHGVTFITKDDKPSFNFTKGAKREVLQHVAHWQWKKEKNPTKKVEWSITRRTDGFIRQLEKHGGEEMAANIKAVRGMSHDQLLEALHLLALSEEAAA